MIDFLLNIFGEIILPGITIGVIFGGAYFAIWRGKRKAYVIANLILAAGLAMIGLTAESHPPFPFVMFLIFYVLLPIQAIIVSLVCGVSWFWERQRKRKAAKIAS